MGTSLTSLVGSSLILFGLILSDDNFAFLAATVEFEELSLRFCCVLGFGESSLSVLVSGSGVGSPFSGKMSRNDFVLMTGNPSMGS
jgi:hypothetical protein